MVQNNEVNRIFINNKDRLTRFGFNYIKQICDFHNVQIVVVDDEVNPKTQSEELAERGYYFINTLIFWKTLWS